MSNPSALDFDPRNLPDDVLAAIGLAIASAAQTESFIQDAIAACCGVDAEFGRAITTHMPAPLRFSVLRSVAEIRIDDLYVLDDLDSQIEKLLEVQSLRNDLAHNLWCRNVATKELFIVTEKARTRLEMNLVSMPINKIKTDAVLIYETGISFYAFLMRHGILPAHPPTGRFRGHKSHAARKKRRGKKL